MKVSPASRRGPKTERQWAFERKVIETSQAQWSMIEALVYAERSGIVICAALFFLHEDRDFWTFWGLLFVVGQVAFLSPVSGTLIYLAERTAARVNRKKCNNINTLVDLKRSYRWIKIGAFLPMAAFSWVAFDIYDRLMPRMGPVDFWRWLFT